jgi:hypothetical protein
MRNAFRAPLVLILFVFTSVGQAAAAAEPADGCAQFVQKFYDWYLARENALMKAKSEKSALDATLREKRSSFSPSLVRALEEDAAAARKSPGEIVGLDFDPFLNSQEMPERYLVGEVHAKADHYLVDVFGVLEGKKDSKPTVVAEVVSRNGQWIFLNFHYEKDNLVSVLAQLKKERGTFKKGD